jgi:hypothetical protein
MTFMFLLTDKAGYPAQDFHNSWTLKQKDHWLFYKEKMFSRIYGGKRTLDVCG